MKYKVLFLVLVAAFLLSAVSPWPAVFTIVNNTSDNVYVVMRYRGESVYFLTATPQGNTADYRVSRFDIARKVYSADVTACNVTTTWGRLDLKTNLRLTFVPCNTMINTDSAKFWGEPGMEKPNFFIAGNFAGNPETGPWWGSYSGKCNPVTGKNCKAFQFLYTVLP